MILEFPDGRTETQQVTGDTRRHTDADSIRRAFSIPRFDPEKSNYPEVIPNTLTHTWDAGAKQSAGGTDVLATGPPGAGKSTLALNLCERVMELNNEAVVWRASTSRSEWIPFAPWTRLCLPAGVDVDARIQPKDPTADAVDVDLEEIVREVVRYDDPVQLNTELIEPGMFHVVYPDPWMNGLQRLYESVQEKQYDGVAFEPGDPLNHWWFGWILARIERGPHHWMTWVCDEIGDLAPEAARNDEYAHYQKVEMLKDCIVDARKKGLTFHFYGHTESDIHSMVRKKVRWRVTMNGTANPTKASQVVGFKRVPMDHDHTSSLPIGEGLMFTQQAFEKFSWKNIPKPVDGTLEVRLDAPVSTPDGDNDAVNGGEPANV